MHAPHIQTALPGPKARDLIDRDAAVSARALMREYPLVIERASGMQVEDVDGNRFLDFMAGIAVTLTSHCHPRVVEAVRRQTDAFLHICGSDFYYSGYTELCARLAEKCGSGWRAFLGNSGAEAVESALKLARHHTGRHAIIAFEGAFHGRTYGAMSVTASKAKQRARFGPLLPGVYHVPYGACHECAYHLTYPECQVHCVESLRQSLFGRLVDPEDVAAVIVEPIQGEGGHRVPPPDYFPALRRLCDEHGILLIADEIQSGMGRTGKFFALEHWNVQADIVTLGKGLASGLPISAMLARDEIMTWPPGSHGSTFGGNPVSCAAALATLDLVDGELIANAEIMGAWLKEELVKLARRHGALRGTSGKGLMLALHFADGRQARAFEYACFQRGLLVLCCGPASVRLAPALIVTKDEAATALEIMDAALRFSDGDAP